MLELAGARAARASPRPVAACGAAARRAGRPRFSGASGASSRPSRTARRGPTAGGRRHREAVGHAGRRPRVRDQSGRARSFPVIASSAQTARWAGTGGGSRARKSSSSRRAGNGAARRQVPASVTYDDRHFRPWTCDYRPDPGLEWVHLAQNPLRDRYWLDRFPALQTSVLSPASRRAFRPRSRLSVAGRSDVRRRTSLPPPASDVALFEQGRIAQAQAARSTGIVVHEPEPDFSQARGAARRAGRPPHLSDRPPRFPRVHRRAPPPAHRVRSADPRRGAFQLDPDGIERLEKEYTARRDAGLEVAALKGTALFRQIGDERLRPGHARQCQRRSVQSHAWIGASRSGARREDVRTIAGRCASGRCGARCRNQNRRRDGHRIEGGRRQRLSDRRLQATAAPVSRRHDGYVVLTPELPAAIRREMTPPTASSSAMRLRPITGCTGPAIACCSPEPISQRAGSREGTRASFSGRDS